MKKEMTRRICVLVMVSLLFLILLIDLSMAQTTVWDKIRNSLSGGAGKLNKDIIAQGLLIVLLTLLVYSILDFIPFFGFGKKKETIKFIIAVIVSILSFLYLRITDIKTILISYEAMGIVLTSFLPFIIILTFTIRWDMHYPQYSFATMILWIALLVFIAFRWLQLPVDQPGLELAWAYPVIAVLSLIFLASKRWIAKLLIRSMLKGGLDKFKNLNKGELAARAMLLKRESDELAGKNPELSKQMAEEAKQLEELAKKFD